MIGDQTLADLCLASYDPGARWDWLLAAPVFVAISRQPGCDVVVFRGSITLDDWIRDVAAVPELTGHPTLGPVHAGFYRDMETTAAVIDDELRPDIEVAITGHSLGAARAAIYAGLSRIHPARLVLFGAPRPGFQRLADALKEISATSYRNATAEGRDRVTDLPLAFPPELPWTPAVRLTDVHAPPDPADASPFRWHHMPLYRKGLPP